MAWKETGRTWYARPASSSAQRTRVSRASPLPPSGDRSKAVIVIVIVGFHPRQNHRRRVLARSMSPDPGNRLPASSRRQARQPEAELAQPFARAGIIGRRIGLHFVHAVEEQPA